jgi:hypothetical protein
MGEMGAMELRRGQPVVTRTDPTGPTLHRAFLATVGAEWRLSAASGVLYALRPAALDDVASGFKDESRGVS